MEDAGGRFRPSGRRVALMAICAVVAVAAFVLLWDVRFNHPDLGPGTDPVLEGVTGATTRANWTVVLIAFEALALAGILVLLLIHPRGGEWAPDGWVADPAPTGTGRMVQIGCPGCGTVFEKADTDIDEPHEQDFRCPNCGRAGRLRMGVHKSAAIRHLSCAACGRDFEAYRDTAECPHCHAPQPTA